MYCSNEYSFQIQIKQNVPQSDSFHLYEIVKIKLYDEMLSLCDWLMLETSMENKWSISFIIFLT